MDIRIEVLRYQGLWVVTQSGPGFHVHTSQTEAVAAGIEAAEKYHSETSGRATVHLWSDGDETLVFDSAGVSVSDATAPRHLAPFSEQNERDGAREPTDVKAV